MCKLPLQLNPLEYEMYRIRSNFNSFRFHKYSLLVLQITQVKSELVMLAAHPYVNTGAAGNVSS